METKEEIGVEREKTDNMDWRDALKAVLVIMLFVGVGLGLSFDFAGYSHLNANWIDARSIEAVNMSGDIAGYPALKEAVENLGDDIRMDENETAALKETLNGTRYIIYNDRYYRITFWGETIKVLAVDDLCCNLSEEDMERFPYLKTAIETQQGVDITYKEYQRIDDFLRDNCEINIIQWHKRYYHVGLGTV